MLVVVASLTVGGGLLARELYVVRAVNSSAPSAQEVSGTALPPGAQPGSPVVELTQDARAHPYGDTVHEVLQKYFNSINQRDYELWLGTVTKQRIQDKTREEWLTAYRSTRDGSILLHRIVSGPDERLHALVSFTSTQDPADAPVVLPARCIHWRMVLPVVPVGGQWKLDMLPPGTAPEYTRC